MEIGEIVESGELEEVIPKKRRPEKGEDLERRKLEKQRPEKTEP